MKLETWMRSGLFAGVLLTLGANPPSAPPPGLPSPAKPTDLCAQPAVDPTAPSSMPAIVVVPDPASPADDPMFAIKLDGFDGPGGARRVPIALRFDGMVPGLCSLVVPEASDWSQTLFTAK